VNSVWWPSPSCVQKPAPLASPSPLSSLPTSELPRRSSGGEREARQWSLFLLRAPRAGSTRQPSSSHLRETPAPEPAFCFIALVSEHPRIPFSHSRPLQFFHLELGFVSVVRDPCQFWGLDPSWAPHWPAVTSKAAAWPEIWVDSLLYVSSKVKLSMRLELWRQCCFFRAKVLPLENSGWVCLEKRIWGVQ
jgi:hypothetical protein